MPVLGEKDKRFHATPKGSAWTSSDSAKWQRSGQLDSWPLLWAWLETNPLPPPQLGEQ